MMHFLHFFIKFIKKPSIFLGYSVKVYDASFKKRIYYTTYFYQVNKKILKKIKKVVYFTKKVVYI